MSARIIPRIFAINENDALTDILLEQYDNFDILWYHWPRDGLFWWVEDYEPIIIVFDRSGQICQIITRRSWKYQHYMRNEVDLNIEIIFTGGNHHPFVRPSPEIFTKEYGDMKRKLLEFENYVPIAIDAIRIPMMYRTGGLSHPSSLGKTVEDPRDIAIETFRDYCSE